MALSKHLPIPTATSRNNSFDFVSLISRNSTASSRNLNSRKEHDQEEENLMSSETFVNEAYDEQVCLEVSLRKTDS